MANKTKATGNKKKSGKTEKPNKSITGNKGIRVLFATSEVYPLVKTGGLADVACYLPMVLHELGLDIRIVLPAYRSVLSKLTDLKPGKAYLIPELDIHFRLLKGKLPDTDIPVYLIDVPELFDRKGGPYQDAAGQDWPDNASRFALFGRVIQRMGQGKTGLRWRPDIVHCNDWHTGIATALLALDKTRPATIFSIHNLAYQGDFSYDTFKSLKLPDKFWSPEALEFYGRLAFIKGGLVYADRLITVSPEYAREITTAEYGYGLEGLLNYRGDKLSGILNGVDYRFWDPRHDPAIKQHYWISNLEDKIINKLHLQRSLGLEENENAILLAHISRLTWQKGIDLILDSINDLLQIDDVQLVVLGTGEAHYEKALQTEAKSFAGRMAVRFEYDETLAHRIQAGADILLMPSRFEPCGLTQMYSLRYGTIPVVRKTGGLASTIVNTTKETIKDHTATGFQFADATTTGLLKATQNAIECYRAKPQWQQIMQTAMQMEFTWKKIAKKYESVYLELLKERSA